MELLPFFEWAETSFLGYIGKTYGGVYATFGQSIHLMSLAVLGGSVLVTDLRLLGVIMKDVPSEVVADQAHKWFRIALAFILATGIFMAAAVAQRMYYNDFFWAKMSALLVGIIFVFAMDWLLLSREAGCFANYRQTIHTGIAFMTDKKPLTLIQKIAAGSSVAIIVAGIIYWSFQVQNVMELLEMAYG